MMNIWIINHYANAAYLSGGYRHYWFSRELVERGYNVTVFCASFIHKGETNIAKKGKHFLIRDRDGVRFVIVRVDPYFGNGIGRVRSMFQFAHGVSFASKRIVNEIGSPDVILGSSVHPLACYEAIKLSRFFKCSNVVEIRDLWPETLVMLGYLHEKSPITAILFQFEKWLYIVCDKLIFTFENGYQYIKDKGWDGSVPKEKVYYINNGVDLRKFDAQSKREILDDPDLKSKSFKIVYTGAVAEANGLSRLVEAARELEGENVLFLVYGDGEEREKLESYCRENRISNIKFKGRVEKKYIPYILCCADCCADCCAVVYAEKLFEGTHNVMKYGSSHNKVPEYLASGKPLIYPFKMNESTIKKYQCSVELDTEKGPRTIAKEILAVKDMSKTSYEKMCANARRAAEEFDIPYLVDRYEEVIHAAIKTKQKFENAKEYMA